MNLVSVMGEARENFPKKNCENDSRFLLLQPRWELQKAGESIPLQFSYASNVNSLFKGRGQFVYILCNMEIG